jgi:hypothetical protein
MSQRADVQIDSKFKNGALPKVGKEIKSSGENMTGSSWRSIFNKLSPKKSVTRFSEVNFQNGDRVPLNSPEETLVIAPPEGENFQGCSIRVKTKADVMVFCSVENGNWKIKFPFSDDPGAESPVTVNVSIAPPEEEEMEPGTGSD